MFTGLRPGEKLHESLVGGDEVPRTSEHKLITRVAVPPLSAADLPYDLARVDGGSFVELARTAATVYLDSQSHTVVRAEGA